LFIWDTGGQERFTNIRSHYFNGARGALIVYDITNKRSFDNVKKWYQEVKKYCEGIPIILVGNKSDLEQVRMIPSKDGEKIAKKLGCPFFEASAKTGENVEFIFRALNSMLLDHAQKKKPKIIENRKISRRGRSKRKATSKKRSS